MATNLNLGGKTLLNATAKGGTKIGRAFLGGTRVYGQQFPLPAVSTNATESLVNGFTVVEFNGNGSFTPASTTTYEFFMVGQGGDGQDADNTPSSYGGGGGGGGEVVFGTITLTAGTTYNIDFDSAAIPKELTFAGIIAHEGGDGGTGNGLNNNGDNGYTSGIGTGGSGGGGAQDNTSTAGAAGTSDAGNGIVGSVYRYGNDGGVPHPTDGNGAGGGGGALGYGGDSQVDGTGGEGGAGYPNTWLGSTLYYGSGGGGYPSGVGSGGGGSAATSQYGSATLPRTNSGGGGGGVNDPSGASNSGGALGKVLIRYKKGS